MEICRLFTVTVTVALIFNCLGVASDDDDDRAKDIQATMYKIIHDLALPRFQESLPVTDRFILLMPGEVLNYYDYVPPTSEDYKDRDPSSKPRDEMLFALADTIPSLNPMAGGLTSKSLSLIYSNILGTIDTGYSTMDPTQQENYTKAMTFLNENIPDPDNNYETQVSRYELYRRYESQYIDIKHNVAVWESGNKSSLDPSAYTEWYRANIVSFNAYVSTAWHRWLVTGQKDVVEEKISIIDVKSLRTIVEQSRTTLQDEALPSSDGGTSFYPVDFVPSNWYEYLLPEPEQLTADQIQAKLADLGTRKSQLENMIQSNIPSADQLNQFSTSMQGKVDEAAKKVQNATIALQCLNYLCQVKRQQSDTKKSQVTELVNLDVDNHNVFMAATDDCSQYNKTGSDPCAEMNDVQNDISKANEAETLAKSKKDSAMNQLTAYSASNSSIQGIIKSLQGQIDELQKQLATAPKPVPSTVAEANGTNELTVAEIAKNWMSFSFDSVSSTKDVDKSSKTYQTAVSFSAGGALWSVSGGASYSRSEQDFAEKMSQSDVTISGKFLRVEMQRTWFQPSIFDNKGLRMQKGTDQVSPGPMTNETEYIKAAQQCQLPEYTTAFLLAKDMVLDFRGADSSTTSHALSESASAHLSGSYGPFSASASFNYGHQSSNLKVSTQSNGLQISIPGAQILGYYTTVMPKFPDSSSYSLNIASR